MKIEQVAQALADWRYAKGKKKQEVAKAQFDAYLEAFIANRINETVGIAVRQLQDDMRGF
jgi:hypothetical protein